MGPDSQSEDIGHLRPDPAVLAENPGAAEARGDARRARIIEIARTLFFENGYQGTSMSMIAARLGGSKSTLYAYYRSKEELFRAIVQTQCDEMMDFLQDAPSDAADVHVVLFELARGFTQMLMRENIIRTFLMVAAECRQSPELAEIFNSAGPAVGKSQMSDYLAAIAKQGKLQIPDPMIACEHFAALCKGELWFNRLLNLSAPPTPDQIDAHAEQIVAIFMAAYGHKAAH